jgi:hypothetical protein
VRIADDEGLNDNEGMSEEEVAQLRKKRQGKAQATILEMVGDIADADAAPAENVRYVATLHVMLEYMHQCDVCVVSGRVGGWVGGWVHAFVRGWGQLRVWVAHLHRKALSQTLLCV